ncbi:MAG TPA: uracil-DNA glycosylase family protein, partial [Chloroflexia bacterium]|nr:uracil-DNA glycosylase family protein [Chloroflexia bacterium]
GLARPAVYITNVVKCRPPQNRDPLPDEIDACAPYLDRQIATIDPLLIVTLGRVSMGRFFPNDKISNVHGQARTVDGRIVMTMWHPAYGLRDAAGKESLKDDFRKIPAVLEQARELRAARATAPPASKPDFSALVAQHITSLPSAPEPPAPAETSNGFAYLAAVNGNGSKAPGRKIKPMAPPPEEHPVTLPVEDPVPDVLETIVVRPVAETGPMLVADIAEPYSPPSPAPELVAATVAPDPTRKGTRSRSVRAPLIVESPPAPAEVVAVEPVPVDAVLAVDQPPEAPLAAPTTVEDTPVTPAAGLPPAPRATSKRKAEPGATQLSLFD